MVSYHVSTYVFPHSSNCEGSSRPRCLIPCNSCSNAKENPISLTYWVYGVFVQRDTRVSRHLWPTLKPPVKNALYCGPQCWVSVSPFIHWIAEGSSTALLAIDNVVTFIPPERGRSSAARLSWFFLLSLVHMRLQFISAVHKANRSFHLPLPRASLGTG